MSLRFNAAETVCGALFILIGGVFALQSLVLDIGTAFRMGPGYFPLVLAGCLVLLGVVVIVQGATMADEPLGPIAWRGMLLILPAPILFGLTVRGLGLIPAVALAAFVGAFASHRMRVLTAVALVIVLSAFCYAVFSWGVGLAVRPFGPWLDW